MIYLHVNKFVHILETLHQKFYANISLFICFLLFTSCFRKKHNKVRPLYGQINHLLCFSFFIIYQIKFSISNTQNCIKRTVQKIWVNFKDILFRNVYTSYITPLIFSNSLINDTEINGPLCLSSICVNFHTKRYFPTHYISYIDYIILKAVRSNKCINMYLVMP